MSCTHARRPLHLINIISCCLISWEVVPLVIVVTQSLLVGRNTSWVWVKLIRRKWDRSCEILWALDYKSLFPQMNALEASLGRIWSKDRLPNQSERSWLTWRNFCLVLGMWPKGHKWKEMKHCVKFALAVTLHKISHECSLEALHSLECWQKLVNTVNVFRCELTSWPVLVWWRCVMLHRAESNK